jgi:predicted regulator of Ras-like GTPase activity (Roadblock/LC7/MglB family)
LGLEKIAIMAEVNLKILVPEKDNQLAMLIESRCRHHNLDTTVVRFDGAEHLARVVATNPHCCIIGTIANDWRPGRSLFEGLDLQQIIWPPVYGICSASMSSADLVQLAQAGVVWAADLDSMMSSSALNLVLSGSAWIRHYGFLFQKINRKTLREGSFLILCTAEEGQYGRILWRGGSFINADFGSLDGLDALYEMALIEDWRIDVHSVFTDPEFESLDIPVLQAINMLVETAQNRKQVLPMGRPPGMTRELSAKVVMGLREAIMPKAPVQKSALSAVEANRADTETLLGFASLEAVTPEETVQAPLTKTGLESSNRTDTKQVNREILGMGDTRLGDFLVGVGSAVGGAVISTDGAYTAVEGDFDVDTVAAVASMSTEYLGAIANALSIQGLEVACFSGNSNTVFLKRESDSFLVSYGPVVKNPGIVAKKLMS